MFSKPLAASVNLFPNSSKSTSSVVYLLRSIVSKPPLPIRLARITLSSGVRPSTPFSVKLLKNLSVDWTPFNKLATTVLLKRVSTKPLPSSFSY